MNIFNLGNVNTFEEGKKKQTSCLLKRMAITKGRMFYQIDFD
jgi:hypothetical protein